MFKGVILDSLIEVKLYSRELLRNSVLKTGNWAANKQELTTKQLNAFLTCTNSVDIEQA
jgi:hypothetical protein